MPTKYYPDVIDAIDIDVNKILIYKWTQQKMGSKRWFVKEERVKMNGSSGGENYP